MPGPARRPRRTRKSGAVALGVSLAFFIAGAIALPRVLSADLETAASASTATAAPAEASPTAEAAPAPSSVPSAWETAEPLARETSNVVAQGAAAPNTPAFTTQAIDRLATLPIKGRAPKTGYDRALFGQAWADVDRNGCDTRNDILQRDLTDIT